jgi:hypothetical protein
MKRKKEKKKEEKGRKNWRCPFHLPITINFPSLFPLSPDGSNII